MFEDERKLRQIEVASICLSMLISAGLGLWGVYLGQRAINLTAQVESLQMRPVFETEYLIYPDDFWGVRIVNIGGGPGEIRAYRIIFEGDDGTMREVSVSGAEGGPDLELNNFFGLAGINENVTRSARTLTNVPWVGAQYGVGESFSLITFPSIGETTSEWRAQWVPKIRSIVSSLCVQIIYESLDGRLYGDDEVAADCADRSIDVGPTVEFSPPHPTDD